MEKSNKGLIVGIIIVILIIGGIRYFSLLNNKEKTDNNNNSNNIVQEDNKKDELQKEEDLVEDKKEVNYTYDNGSTFKTLKTLTINGIDVMDKISDEDYNSIDINKKDNFVIINYSTGGTCGYENWELFVFDYNANLLYKNEDIPNDLDKLVYAGKYEIDKNNNITLDYHLSCDTDCNICEKLYDEERIDLVCENIQKYSEVVTKAKYRVNYSSKKFGEEVLISSTPFKSDETYHNYFEKCSN